MKTQLFIGQSSLRGALAKYSGRFNLLEIRAELGRLPRATILRRWRDEVPEDFVFSIMLSREVGRLGPKYESELELGLQAAEALRAKWIVLQTDPTIGPSQRSRQRLQALFAQMGPETRRIAWEPHGVWQEDEALTWTRDLGVHLVRDIFRGDAISQDIIYSRMPGIGTASRMSARALENAGSSLSLASEGYIIIGGDAAGKAAQYLRSLLREDGSTGSRGHNDLQFQEVFGERVRDDIEEFDDSSDDEETDEFDDESDDEETDLDPSGDDGEADSGSDYIEEGSSADEDVSDEDEREQEHRRLPKKGPGAKRK